MHYGKIKYCDIANGIGVRVSLFVSGCTNHCEQCFQPETWNFDYGYPFKEETENDLLEYLGNDFIQGITVLGGEPFEPDNQRVLLPFLCKVREQYPDKDIWMYSGFGLEDELLAEDGYPHCEVTEEILSLVDVLVDGRFEIAKKDISLMFRGSSNQRLIDMNKTRETGTVTLWSYTASWEKRDRDKSKNTPFFELSCR